MPFYLHPRNPLPQDARIYKGAEWLLGPIWAFGHETAVHALRLMGSGLFDKHPKLQIVLGHMGEGLPFNIWRVDNANAWIPNRNNYPAKKKIGEYFQNNFYITVSGNFCTQALLTALMTNGSDRIMFSTDWPFENIDHAAVWFDAATISEEDRIKHLIEASRLQSDDSWLDSLRQTLSADLRDTAQATAMADRLKDRKRVSAKENFEEKMALVKEMAQYDREAIAREILELRARRKLLER